MHTRMGAGKSLETWGKHGRFTYSGSVEKGTRVTFGRGGAFVVSAETYAELLTRFGGQLALVGNSRRPPRGSLGSWLQAHVGSEHVIVAYVGPILTREGYAERVGDQLKFA